MPSLTATDHAWKAARRLAFAAVMRTGRRPTDLQELLENAEERKFNHNHDPANGQFTFGAGGSVPSASRGSAGSSRTARHARMSDTHPEFYRGATGRGIGKIAPVSGGYFDAAGRYVPEVFAPDRLALTNPASALAHYVGRSGKPRNFYLNAIDTSHVRATDFPDMRALIQAGKPGRYVIVGSLIHEFGAGKPETAAHFSAGNTVGRLKLRTTGHLVVASNGRYAFDGIVGAETDHYVFYSSQKRSARAEYFTQVGRRIPGKIFDTHIIGTKPMSDTGLSGTRP